MKAIKLTYNQSKKLVWERKEVRVKQNGMVLYINNYGDSLVATTWSNAKVEVNVILNEMWRD